MIIDLNSLLNDREVYKKYLNLACNICRKYGIVDKYAMEDIYHDYILYLFNLSGGILQYDIYDLDGFFITGFKMFIKKYFNNKEAISIDYIESGIVDIQVDESNYESNFSNSLEFIEWLLKNRYMWKYDCCELAYITALLFKMEYKKLIKFGVKNIIDTLGINFNIFKDFLHSWIGKEVIIYKDDVLTYLMYKVIFGEILYKNFILETNEHCYLDNFKEVDNYDEQRAIIT